MTNNNKSEFLNLLKKQNFQTANHPFHLVTPSPWPFIVSCTVLLNILSFVCYLHNISLNSMLFTNKWIYIITFSLFILSIFCWFRDIHIEAITGNHTKNVQNGLKLGVILFIVSEIMFFFGFFWAFFHCSLAPSIAIGCIWPPENIDVLNPWGLPLLNTIILLSSGISITWAHRAIVSGITLKPTKKNFIVTNTFQLDKKSLAWQYTLVALLITICFGVIFTLCQLYEYMSASFSINDGIYGSIFYMATGFHGFHVIIGTILLIVTFIRTWLFHFTSTHHIGFEAAAWYWHFVDVVWIFLYIIMYCWGS